MGFFNSLSEVSSMTEALEKAKRKYEGKRIKMSVSFNEEKDKELIAFAKSINFSEWVKEKMNEQLALHKNQK